MSKQARAPMAPTQLRYKLLLAYCLMSIMPILIGLYIASLFIRYPFETNSTNLVIVSGVMLFSVALSFLGFKVTRQLTEPIVDMAGVAKNIAAGKLDNVITRIKGVDELDELSESLNKISNNARELLEKVEKLSLKDNLTGLYNASYLRERLGEEIQRAIHYQQPCSLVYLNINGFDDFAVLYGRPVAEALLKGIAKILGEHLSPLDRAARVMKSEFAVIFADRNKKKAMEAAEKIRKDIGLFRLSGQDGVENTVFTASVGISENPIDGISADELLQKAKERVGLAKAKGSQAIEAFS